MNFDTNIIIAYLEGDPAVTESIRAWTREGRILFLSTVAESEVLSFSQFISEERIATEKFLEENFTSVVFDRTVARIAAEIRRTAQIKFPDAAIAATALFTRTPLSTRNLKDFKKVPNLQIVSL